MLNRSFILAMMKNDPTLYPDFLKENSAKFPKTDYWKELLESNKLNPNQYRKETILNSLVGEIYRDKIR